MRRLTVLLFLLAPVANAVAGHHGWRVVEAFSDATGTYQFVELQATGNGEDTLSGFTIDATSSINLGNVAGSVVGDRYLFATSEFQALFGIAADITIPANFLATSNGEVAYSNRNEIVWTNDLPLDGVRSLAVDNLDTGTTPASAAIATPNNFAGVGGAAITDKFDPVNTGLPASALEITCSA